MRERIGVTESSDGKRLLRTRVKTFISRVTDRTTLSEGLHNGKRQVVVVHGPEVRAAKDGEKNNDNERQLPKNKRESGQGKSEELNKGIQPPGQPPSEGDSIGGAEEPEFRWSFDRLVGATQILATDQPDTDWLEDQSAVERRWRKAVRMATGLSEHVISPDDPDVEQQSLATINNSLNKWDWQTPGLSFKVLDSGYRLLEQSGEPLTEEMYNIIDLRDMEYSGPQVPGNLDAFKTLSKDERQHLQDDLTQVSERGLYGKGDNYTMNAPATVDTFRNVMLLRQHMIHMKYGVPDVELSREELDRYAQDLLAYRIKKNPDYGKLPEEINDMDRQVVLSLRELYSYLDVRRSPHEPVAIDTYSLTETLGMEDTDINAFVDNGIIKPTDVYHAPDDNLYGIYELEQPYFDFWWARAVRARGKK